MSEARQATLAAIRRAIAANPNDGARSAAVTERLSAHRRNLIPARGAGSEAERVTLFAKMAEELAATTAQVTSLADVPAAIADYLRKHNLPQRLRHGADPLLNGLNWAVAPQIARTEGRAAASDEVSLSHAFAGVAETGTLVLLSGKDNPTTLNFLPETHIVVIEAGRILPAYEDVFDAIRRQYGSGAMPRTVNMITGPSRTADVEQTIELGAHGPKRLHVIIAQA